MGRGSVMKDILDAIRQIRNENRHPKRSADNEKSPPRFRNHLHTGIRNSRGE